MSRNFGFCIVLGLASAACGSGGHDDTPTGGGGSGATSGGGTGATGSGGTGGNGATGGSGGSAGSGGTATGGAGSGSATSPGCGKTGAFTGLDESATIDVAGVSRSYVVSVPDTYDPDHPHPLIFGVHGLNADGKAARGYLGLEKATGEPAIFIYPTATNPSTGWKMKEGEGDIEFWDALLDAYSNSHCIDPKRVFSMGFSHGAMFTNNLTCARLDKLRAIAPVGGSGPWFGAECTGAMPAMITHGMTDGTVPFTDGQGTRDHFLGENGCGSTTQPYDPDPCVAYEGCQSPVVFCAFDGGHTVPSFAGQAVRDFFATFQ